MEVSIRGEMTVQFEVVNPATLELNKNKVNSHEITNGNIQGGSDKSGIFFFFLLNGTTQLKINRFY
jgi:hypothetical protein